MDISDFIEQDIPEFLEAYAKKQYELPTQKMDIEKEFYNAIKLKDIVKAKRLLHDLKDEFDKMANGTKEKDKTKALIMEFTETFKGLAEGKTMLLELGLMTQKEIDEDNEFREKEKKKNEAIKQQEEKNAIEAKVREDLEKKGIIEEKTQAQKALEEKKKQDEKLLLEAQKIEEEKKKQEEQNELSALKIEEALKLENQKKVEEENKRIAEQKKVEELKAQEERKRQEEEIKKEELKRIEQERLEEQRKTEELRVQEQKRQEEERKRQEEENKKIEAQKAEEERKRLEEQRKAEELKAQEQKRQEEERKRIEAQKAEEERKRQEEEKKRIEEQRKNDAIMAQNGEHYSKADLLLDMVNEQLERDEMRNAIISYRSAKSELRGIAKQAPQELKEKFVSCYSRIKLNIEKMRRTPEKKTIPDTHEIDHQIIIELEQTKRKLDAALHVNSMDHVDEQYQRMEQLVRQIQSPKTAEKVSRKLQRIAQLINALHARGLNDEHKLVWMVP